MTWPVRENEMSIQYISHSSVFMNSLQINPRRAQSNKACIKPDLGVKLKDEQKAIIQIIWQ
jgi:hypothetical protein